MENIQTKTDNYDNSKEVTLFFKTSLFLAISVSLTWLTFGIGSLPDVLKAVGFAAAVVLWVGYLITWIQCMEIASGKFKDKLFVRLLFSIFLAVAFLHALFSLFNFGFGSLIIIDRLIIFLISLIILVPQIITLTLGVTGLKSPKKNLAVLSVIFSGISLIGISYLAVWIASYIFWAILILIYGGNNLAG